MHTIDEIKVDDSNMEVFLFEPDGDGPHPAIILAMHIPGHMGIEHDEFTLKTAERLAHNGYAVAVPFIFHWWEKDAVMDTKRKEFSDDRCLLDLKATFEYLKKRNDVDSRRIGIVGHCWGGRVAWLGAGHIPQLKALAVFYGGRIKEAMGIGNPPAIKLAENIRCPVIGFFGNEDSNPTPEDVDDYEEALKKAGVSYRFYRYDGAGHAFQSFSMPERYREKQSEDAWEKVLDFLKAALK